ncbi:MAG: 2-phospho-L-lactate transferase CofD family protein [Candidatus Peribacteria bacterium]|nr:2-phospho-L-lactate transferase CofD family protein [Candidatus Peribacteria bacterium]
MKRAFLTPDNVKANPKVIKVISKADYIIISFGDLYTSIVPNFLVK